MPYFDRNADLKLFYSLHGKPANPPFLLVHGWTCDSTDWSFTIPALLQSYYVITIDMRGHGHSSAPTLLSYNIQDFADDAVALLHHLMITKDVLVTGHSMGGIVASCLTGRHPNLFQGLVVIDPPYWRTKAFWSTMLPKWDEMQNRLMFVTEAFGNQMPPPEIIQPWLMTWYDIRMQAVQAHVMGEALKGAFGEGMLGQQAAHTELVKARKCPRLAVYMTEVNVENEKGLDMRTGDEVFLV
jgi:pimeloyl-ACP methyl ester carboxylesterase